MEFPFNAFDLNAIYEFATSQSMSYWINLGITFILSSLITGIFLVIVLKIASKETGSPIKVGNAFIAVLLINLINFFGIMGLLLSFIAGVPYLGIILPALIWIVFLKLFFGNLGWLYAIVIGILFYVISLFVIPHITSYIAGFIPI